MFSAENSSVKNYIMIGAGIALAGTALYFLAKDGEMVKFDAKIHTVEMLRGIVHEVYVR